MPETYNWSIGLLNQHGKYLTLEKFGSSTLNVDGTSLRKKQTWILEQEGDVIYFKSHLSSYLSADAKGNVSCKATEKEKDTKFTIETQANGKWALKSAYNEYLWGSGDQLKCDAKTKELWTVQLAIHPQINLKSTFRKRYAHLEDDRIRVNELIPWGADAMITLNFIDGKYALAASNNKFLVGDGSLSEEATADCLFSIEFHKNEVAFKGKDGKFLAVVGPGDLQIGKKTAAGKDELFQMEDSHPQCSFIGHNDRRVSVKQGVDVTANQRELSDTEIFQMEFDKSGSEKVSLRSSKDGKYWEVAKDGGVTATAAAINPQSQFDLEWHGDQVAFKSSSGKYLGGKSNGQLELKPGTEVGDTEKYTLELVNRPILVLRGEFGFVGLKGTSNIIECNRAVYDVFQVSQSESKGRYKLRSSSGKYWHTEDNGSITVTDDASKADDYTFILPKYNHLCIKAPNGNLLKGSQNGLFTAKDSEMNKTALWEY